MVKSLQKIQLINKEANTIGIKNGLDLLLGETLL